MTGPCKSSEPVRDLRRSLACPTNRILLVRFLNGLESENDDLDLRSAHQRRHHDRCPGRLEHILDRRGQNAERVNAEAENSDCVQSIKCWNKQLVPFLPGD